MIAEELINHMIPPLKPSDDGHKAIVWMDEFRCNHLPVVAERELLGFISEEIILESNDIEKSVVEFDLVGKDATVELNSHFYDILRVAGENKLEIVAAIDADGNYIGVITVQEIMTSFAQTASVQMPGSILVLSVDLIDYSLAEIARFVEENNAKIISSTIVEDTLDAGKIKVTIKINQLEISRIVATLERFGYTVIGRYQDQQPEDAGKERIDMLMRYLNI
jgi:acetoin utilization protein AcuB